jgi:CBS domain-containing protein
MPMRAPSLLVKDVAVHNPVTALAEESIADCAKRMHAEHVGCLVVVEKTGDAEVPVGMLTAGDVMAERPAVVEEDDDLLDALALMRERGVRRLPVTRPDGGLVGVIALDNVLETIEEELDAMVGVMKAQRTRELRTRP